MWCGQTLNAPFRKIQIKYKIPRLLESTGYYAELSPIPTLSIHRIKSFFFFAKQGCLPGINGVASRVSPDNLAAICQLTFKNTTALHEAAASGSRKAIEFIISKGGIINLNSLKNGLTPLHCALINKKRDAILCLLELGANSNMPSSFGETPRQLAQRIGNADLFILTSAFRLMPS